MSKKIKLPLIKIYFYQCSKNCSLQLQILLFYFKTLYSKNICLLWIFFLELCSRLSSFEFSSGIKIKMLFLKSRLNYLREFPSFVSRVMFTFLTKNYVYLLSSTEKTSITFSPLILICDVHNFPGQFCLKRSSIALYRAATFSSINFAQILDKEGIAGYLAAGYMRISP